MRTVLLRNLWAHKRRLVGTVVAVVLGVAFLCGTLVVGDTARAGFDTAFRDANAGIDAVVRSSDRIGVEMARQVGLVDQGLVDEVLALDVVAAAAPSIEASAQLLDADGDPVGSFGPPTLGGNWVPVPGLNPYRLVEGRAPETDGEVVIDRASSDSAALAIGDRTTVLTPERVEVTVVGVATFGDHSSLGGTTFTAFTTAQAARALLGDEAAATSIAVEAADGTSPEELVAALEPLLPEGTEALTGTELSAEATQDIEEDFLGFFEGFLLAFASIALLVAVFSIYNTFSILVAQRSRELALLRALGGSRRQVLAATAAEAGAVGVLASALGVAAGIGLASAMLALLDAVDLEMPNDGLRVGVSSVAVAVAVGVGVTLAASLVPAVRASRLAPMAALRDTGAQQSGRSVVRVAVGVVTAACGVAALVEGARAADVPLTGVGALGTVLGVIVLGPVLARPAARLLGAPVARARGAAGALARNNAVRNPRRTASTAVALTVGVSIVSLFTVVGASLSSTIEEGIGAHVEADLAVAASFISGVGIDPALAPALEGLAEVDVAAGIGLGTVVIGGDDHQVSVADPGRLAAVIDLDPQEGDPGAVGPGALALSSAKADDLGVGVGDRLDVRFVDGAVEALTVGTVYATRDLVGDVVLRPDTWDPHAGQRFDTTVLARIAAGVDLATARAAAEEVAESFGAPDVMDRAELIDSQTAMIDQLLGIVYGLLAVAILIALMGIANTSSLSVHERTRELGLLRAVGQTRRQVRSMVRWEAVLIAVYGTVVGLVLGVVVGWGLLEAVAGAEDLDTVFAVPYGSLVVVVVAGALVGVVAAVRPARRAARLNVLDAIAAE